MRVLVLLSAARHTTNASIKQQVNGHVNKFDYAIMIYTLYMHASMCTRDVGGAAPGLLQLLN